MEPVVVPEPVYEDEGGLPITEFLIGILVAAVVLGVVFVLKF